MLNGFIVEINNSTVHEQAVVLFKKMNLSSGVTVYGLNSNTDYESLVSMATTEGFKGNGIMTNNENINQLTIVSNNKSTHARFKNIHDNVEIIIDGTSNYISLVIPPATIAVVQLLPMLK